MIFASIYDLVKHHNDPYYVSIGASGAVSAILFSYILFDPWSKILLFAIIPVPGIIFGVVSWLIVNIWLNVRETISTIMPIFTGRYMVFCSRLYLILH